MTNHHHLGYNYTLLFTTTVEFLWCITDCSLSKLFVVVICSHSLKYVTDCVLPVSDSTLCYMLTTRLEDLFGFNCLKKIFRKKTALGNSLTLVSQSKNCLMSYSSRMPSRLALPAAIVKGIEIQPPKGRRNLKLFRRAAAFGCNKRTYSYIVYLLVSSHSDLVSIEPSQSPLENTQ